MEARGSLPAVGDFACCANRAFQSTGILATGYGKDVHRRAVADDGRWIVAGDRDGPDGCIVFAKCTRRDDGQLPQLLHAVLAG